jgi:DNA polymerase III epsilon subunit-like protein
LLLHKTSIDGLFSSELKDTMIISREKWPSERKHNLGAICERLGIPYVQAHRALPDTEMTAKVFIEFMKLLRGEYVVQAKSNENEIKERIRFELP